MNPMGRVWNTLSEYEKINLLRHCKTEMTDAIIKHESTLDWSQLWPMRQDAVVWAFLSLFR
jgi:hypothetical protein